MKKLIGIVLFAFSITAYADGFIELLEWQVREGGADNWAQKITSPGQQQSITVIEAPFDWDTGIRLGLGRAFYNNAFDLYLVYTHYQTTAFQQAFAPVYSAFVGNYFANNTNGANFGPYYTHANIRWQFFYNTLDLNLGKQFKIDEVLQLHPFIGLKAASINQHIYSNWLNPLSADNFTRASENLKNDFTGFGPTIGVDSTWPIYTCARQSFNLIGNLALGLLWGHWDFNDVYSNDAPTTIVVNVSSVNGASPVVIGLLGLQWMYQFTQTQMSVRLAYEAQVWFNQVQFYSLNMGRLNRPLSLQGGNLEFQFTF